MIGMSLFKSNFLTCNIGTVYPEFETTIKKVARLPKKMRKRLATVITNISISTLKTQHMTYNLFGYVWGCFYFMGTTSFPQLFINDLQHLSATNLECKTFYNP